MGKAFAGELAESDPSADALGRRNDRDLAVRVGPHRSAGPTAGVRGGDQVAAGNLASCTAGEVIGCQRAGIGPACSLPSPFRRLRQRSNRLP